MPGNSGYQGFTPHYAIVPPSLKPGETLISRATKFRDAGSGLVYGRPPPMRSRWGETVSRAAAASVTASHYHVPDRRGVSAQFIGDFGQTRKALNAKSVYGTTYTLVSEDLARLREAAKAPDAFEGAFRAHAENGVLDLGSLASVVDAGLGGHAAQWVEDKFRASFRGAREGRITWEQFRGALAGILRAAIHDASPNSRAAAPEWLLMSTQPVPKIVGPAPLRSCYQIDMGMAGETPQQRPYTHKGGMASTSQDLLSGTSKDTYHLPGYCGHIPASRRSPAAKRHGDAENPRPSRELLSMNTKADVAGYTGHVPRNLRNDRGARLCGLDPMTTSGAAALHHML